MPTTSPSLHPLDSQQVGFSTMIVVRDLGRSERFYVNHFGFRVTGYRDEARGEMGRNAEGRIAMLRVGLAPRANFDGDKRPGPDEIEAMHHAAHESCFIANSVMTEVVCTPVAE